jgi:cytochrome P450
VPPAEQVDLSDLEFWGRPLAEREAAFTALRAERPMAFFEEPDVGGRTSVPLPRGPGYYAVTRHADVVQASRHPEIFRSGRGATSIQDLPPEMLEYFGGMINADDPRHARLRRIVSNAFNPRVVKSIEASIEEVAGAIVDKALRAVEFDFVTEVAARLPLKVICDMLGIAEADYDTVFSCSNVILSAGDPEYIAEDQDVVLAFMEAGATLTALMADLAASRLKHPTDDLTSLLLHANIDGEALSHDELASFFVLLLAAGNETTRNAISHGLWALTEHPDQRALWQADPGGVTPTAVEEVVRWATPVIFMRRSVADDAGEVVLGGQTLRGGDKILLFYASANRDEEVFPDPFTFDVQREPNPHVGFGAAGPHFCLGAHLARREIAVMFRELFARAPGIVATAPPDRLHSNFINGIKHLPATVAA